MSAFIVITIIILLMLILIFTIWFIRTRRILPLIPLDPVIVPSTPINPPIEPINPPLIPINSPLIPINPPLIPINPPLIPINPLLTPPREFIDIYQILVSESEKGRVIVNYLNVQGVQILNFDNCRLPNGETLYEYSRNFNLPDNLITYTNLYSNFLNEISKGVFFVFANRGTLLLSAWNMINRQSQAYRNLLNSYISTFQNPQIGDFCRNIGETRINENLQNLDLILSQINLVIQEMISLFPPL